MKNLFAFLLCLFILCSITGKAQKPAMKVAQPNVAMTSIDDGAFRFEDYFLDKTMRVDYYHAGTAREEHFAIDQIVSDGKWPGSKVVTMENLNLGLYYFEIKDKGTGNPIYSRGFSSVFGEWQSIPEAATNWGAFPESIRFPWPKKPFTVILKKRNQENIFQEIWTKEIDPASRIVNPADLKPTHIVDVVVDNGPAETKVDIVILGDGYASNQMNKFRNDVKRLSDVLLNNEPFKSRKKDINIRAVETPSEEPGVNKPHPGVFKRTPLSVHYGSFDSERYALTYDNKTIRDVAAEVPYDFMIILVNERTYGGGGIYNLYTTVSADNKFANYIMVHEFGHHMAGLADEYYTSSVSYEAPEIQAEPWEPNITNLKDKEHLKWKELIATETPLPTPWNKAEFDQFGYKIQKQRDSIRAIKAPETVMEDLFMRQKQQEDAYFSTEKFKDKVGAFEGGDYMQFGLYRPQVDCIMFTRHMTFCKVCRKTLDLVMDQYTH